MTSTTGGPGKLRVYHLAADLCGQVDEMLRSVQCPQHLRDQVRRCVDSLLLNLAEGAGHAQPGKKAYHFQIAHSEAYEIIAALNRLEQLNPRASFKRLYETTTLTSKMLIPLIQKWQAAKNPK